MNQFYVISRKRFESDFGGECAFVTASTGKSAVGAYIFSGVF